MTEKLSALSELAKSNIKWIFVIIFIILGMWLDTRYETTTDAELLEERVNELEDKLRLYIQAADLEKAHHDSKLTTLEGRVTKKIGVMNDNMENINENENTAIRHDERLKKLENPK